LAAFCRTQGVPPPPSGARRHSVRCADFALRWEQHTEFTTYTWEIPRGRDGPDRLAWCARLPQPGPHLISVDLELVLEGDRDAVIARLDPTSLALSRVGGGAAEAASDFRADGDGFVRQVVVNRGLSAGAAGALVQRLLELESYRVLATLGLPEAQRRQPSINAIEQELALVVDTVARDDGFAVAESALRRLTAMAAELEAGAAASQYRFAATRAYFEIVEGRLEAIEEQAAPGHSTFARFLSRRLAPAKRTCRAIEARQENLSERVSRAAQLLRTRVEMELASQNRDLLAAMNERARQQLHLQQTVEGLSAAAISYYVIGLIGYFVKPLHAQGLAPAPEIILAVATPIVVIACLVGLSRLRRQPPTPAGAP